MTADRRRLAAIDVGTNTTRLLVAEAGREGPAGSSVGNVVQLDRRLLFTRLGEGVDATRTLKPSAIARTVAAIEELAGIATNWGAEAIRVAGTSAVREAANREELRAEVAAATGLTLEVVDGGAEAALSFAGATGDLPAGRYLVLDIGGGSTELALGDAASGSIEGRISLPLGVVRLTERHLHNDPPLPSELAALEAGVDATLDRAVPALPQAESAGLVGVAGTITSLAAIKLGLDHYDPAAVHLSTLTAGEIGRLYRKLAAMTLPEREALPPLPPGRADVIVAGCGIAARVMARWSFPAVVVSEKDILDALVQELSVDRPGSPMKSSEGALSVEGKACAAEGGPPGPHRGGQEGG